MGNLPKRTLGESGIEIAELGLGCNRIGQDAQTGHDWIALLERAVDLGVNLFDTAAQYAGGRSEKLIGNSLEPPDDCPSQPWANPYPIRGHDSGGEKRPGRVPPTGSADALNGAVLAS